MWDMTIRLCTCEGPIGYAEVLDAKSKGLRTNALDTVLPVTVQSENFN